MPKVWHENINKQDKNYGFQLEQKLLVVNNSIQEDVKT